MILGTLFLKGTMNGNFIGELCAVGVAACNAAACSFFNLAEKKVSTFTVNLLKTIVALGSVTVLRAVLYGSVSLAGIPLKAWIYLSLSGLAGFVFGDFFYFASFLYLPYRISMMIYNCSTIVTALAAWGLYGQRISLAAWGGIFLVVIGLGVILFARNQGMDGDCGKGGMMKGLFLAVLGMLGQALGVLFSNQGLLLIDMEGGSMAASHIRLTAGTLVLLILTFAGKKTRGIRKDMSDGKSILLVAAGGLIGCAIGTTLTLQSLYYIPAGISSAISSVSPVMVLIVTVLVFHEKVKWAEAAGALLCIFGIAVLSI